MLQIIQKNSVLNILNRMFTVTVRVQFYGLEYSIVNNETKELSILFYYSSTNNHELLIEDQVSESDTVVNVRDLISALEYLRDLKK